LPTVLDLSHDDQYSIEGESQVISLRSIKSHQLIAKYEGHLYPIQNLKFSTSTFTFVSTANSECMLWSPLEQIKNKVGDLISEVSQPEKILDLSSSDHIAHVTLKEIGDDKTFMIAASTDSAVNIFYAKVSKSNKASVTKSKVSKRECLITLGVHEQMISASLVNETNLSVVHGSLFSMKRSQVKLLDDQNKVQKEITLSGDVSNIKELPKKPKALNNDQYQVMGIEEEGNARVNNMMNGGNIRQLVPQ
jgi:WD40 repeat protein